MHAKPFPESDGSAIWMSEQEIESFIECAPHEKGEIALHLCSLGLRVAEVAKLTNDRRYKDEEGDYWLRVHGKGDKERRTPLPKKLALVNLELGVTARTIQNWCKAAGEEYHRRNPSVDEALLISCHDLRRSWAGHLLQGDGETSGVDPLIVMEWGGWESFEVFRTFYINVASPDWQRKERAKIARLN